MDSGDGIATVFFPDRLIKDYQEAIDGLYDTLCELSSLPFEESGGRVPRLMALMALMARVCRGRLNEMGVLLGLQRRLDIHWLRLCMIVSIKKRPEAKPVSDFIRKIAGALGDEGSEVNHSALQLDMALKFKPTGKGRSGTKLSFEDGAYEIELDSQIRQFVEEAANP